MLCISCPRKGLGFKHCGFRAPGLRVALLLAATSGIILAQSAPTRARCTCSRGCVLDYTIPLSAPAGGLRGCSQGQLPDGVWRGVYTALGGDRGGDLGCPCRSSQLLFV